MREPDHAREDLLAFERDQPENFFRADPHLRRVLARRAPGLPTEELERFGWIAAGPLDRAVRENDLRENHPRLDRFGPYGDRREEVLFHPTYHQAGALIYGSGVMSVLGEPGRHVDSLARFYLSSLCGEAGHNCPLACTAGVIKALTALGTPELKARWLPRLLSRDYEELAHGAQFLTEVQGGSDVGANAVVARREGDAFTIHGEKWFCSNATADLILMTARPESAPAGTKGLGLFLVERRLPDGALNRYELRRLKDKLGTRTMASAEIDFRGAIAHALGPLEDGFKNMMRYVITTSRLFNAVGTTANARRAVHVARAYAHRRRAFGQPISAYAMVQETVADMEAETCAMTSGAFHLIALADKLETGAASDEEAGFFRTAVSLNKLRSAQSAHEVVLSGIEVLGGNGAIESFSVLPRLLRDNVVFENWEGTHNVLLTQVLRDAQRLRLHEPFLAHLQRLAGKHPRLSPAVNAAAGDLEALLNLSDGPATLGMRDVGPRLSWLHWAAALLDDGADGPWVDHLLDRRIGPPARRDSSYLARIAALAKGPSGH